MRRDWELCRIVVGIGLEWNWFDVTQTVLLFGCEMIDSSFSLEFWRMRESDQWNSSTFLSNRLNGWFILCTAHYRLGKACERMCSVFTNMATMVMHARDGFGLLLNFMPFFAKACVFSRRIDSKLTRKDMWVNHGDTFMQTARFGAVSRDQNHSKCTLREPSLHGKMIFGLANFQQHSFTKRGCSRSSGVLGKLASSWW